MSNSNRQDRGNLLWRISKKFSFAAEKIIPDTMVFALILTGIVLAAAIIITPNKNPVTLLGFWYEGMFSGLAFTFQMAFMVITCAAAARSPQVKKLMNMLGGIPKTPIAAMVFLMIFGYLTSFLNWAFCTVVTPILAMIMAKRIKGLHFPMMVAAGYSAQILGQCMGPSATVYALVASADHPMVDKIGVLSQSQTTYNTMNVILWVILAVVTVLIAAFTLVPKSEMVELRNAVPADTLETEQAAAKTSEARTFSNVMNNSRILMWLFGICGLIVIVSSVVTKGLMNSLSLNFIIFLFMTVNCFLYDTPTKYIKAHFDCMTMAAEIMVLYLLYYGISGIMSSSGLGQILVDGLIGAATAKTLPVITYWIASFVNLFIPSQGGQWVIQGPIAVDSALALGADVRYVINAFVYGDQGTNMLQPLFAIPALAIVNMKLKDVWGLMAFIWVFWFVITSIGLYVLPMLV